MSGAQSASKAASNRRKYPRVSLSDPAYITVLGTPGRTACTVLDISETGAQLQFENSDLIPGNFKLYIDRFDFVGECVIVWRSEGKVGVIFESPPLF